MSREKRPLGKGRIPVREMTRLAMLFALTVVLMLVESMVPPIPSMPPGVKLGLSNIAVMYCLFYLGRKQAILLLILKSLFVMMTRGPTAFLLSFSGGLLSVLVMVILLSRKRNRPSYLLISVCAAVAHNAGQLVIASLLLTSPAVFFYAPVLVISGVIMGIVTGTMLRILMPAMCRLNGKGNAD